MRLSREEVVHIAALCRITVTDDDITRLQDQLSNILQQFEVLKKLDTEQVPPTAQSVEMRNIFRNDAPRPSLPREDVLRNAPQHQEDQLRIRAVLED
ncbi:MAG: Asp-tRNA(Asn)/Glu-tRNA(Gln) amidotransferase subunit GatC [Chloroflexi bacterium]|nr:Asp-tRNA(Asn)/Glu-tRNA(Gln) amidotransferase subunit GatC [Chloroflexota bacterium]